MSIGAAGGKPTIRTYGVAGKWANGNAPNRASASASDLFLGPATKGTDWGAAFASAFGNNQDMVLQDYLKRNYTKFSGGVLEGMLEQAGLVEWYKKKMADEAKKLSESLSKSLQSVESEAFKPLLSDRSKDILSALEKPRPIGAFSNKTTGANVDVSV